MIIQKQKL
jgi:septation ring formation regulator EzrA